MPWAVAAAGLAAAGTITGSILSSNAAGDAANAQTQAANNATQLQQLIYNQTQQNLQPYQQAGTNALSVLLQQLGIGAGPGGAYDPNAPLSKPFTIADFQSSPGYQFQMQQGIDAIQNSASARGGVVSGNALRELNTYGQGVANQDWWNAYNAYVQRQNNTFSRLSSLVGSGQNAAANLGGFGQSFTQQAGANMIGAGNAQAGGIVGQAGAISGGLNNLAGIGAYLYNQNNQPAGQVPINYGTGGYGGATTNGTVYNPTIYDSYNPNVPTSIGT